jgi:hypothetical protein
LVDVHNRKAEFMTSAVRVPYAASSVMQYDSRDKFKAAEAPPLRCNKKDVAREGAAATEMPTFFVIMADVMVS